MRTGLDTGYLVVHTGDMSETATDLQGNPIRAWADIPATHCPTDAERRAHLVAVIRDLDAAGGLAAPGSGGSQWAHARAELRGLDRMTAAGYGDGTAA